VGLPDDEPFGEPHYCPGGMTRTVEVEEHRRAYLEALMARDVGAARSAVDAAIALGVPVEDIYLDVLTPALYEIGRSWAVGNFSIADEHSATTVTQSVLGMLGPRMRTAPKDGRLAIVSGSPEERHALGVQMVADFLEGDGWEVLNLGASTPAADLALLADAERPDVVALSTSTPAGLPGAAEAVTELLALDPRPLVVLGGQLWAGQARGDAPSLGADLVVDGPQELVAQLRERFPPQAPDAEERGF
jgi:MerR family transcriptional regulator, light-induced transcriptional regulator